MRVARWSDQTFVWLKAGIFLDLSSKRSKSKKSGSSNSFLLHVHRVTWATNRIVACLDLCTRYNFEKGVCYYRLFKHFSNNSSVPITPCRHLHHFCFKFQLSSLLIPRTVSRDATTDFTADQLTWIFLLRWISRCQMSHKLSLMLRLSLRAKPVLHVQFWYVLQRNQKP